MIQNFIDFVLESRILSPTDGKTVPRIRLNCPDFMISIFKLRRTAYRDDPPHLVFTVFIVRLRLTRAGDEYG